MHKDFYASGFLYHIPSEQILLQQHQDSNSTSLTWSLFGGLMQPQESFKTAFQRIMYTSLKIRLIEETIFDVYDYFNENLGKNNGVVYAELAELEHFSAKKNITFTWVNTRNINKLPISKQMKHDITIGQRVILAKGRDIEEYQK